tara:strand:- start:688 stop:831 length:144 start_codon:yes stop_codon:yes gene_type:complete
MKRDLSKPLASTYGESKSKVRKYAPKNKAKVDKATQAAKRKAFAKKS